jgi:hypothetical protein
MKLVMMMLALVFAGVMLEVQPCSAGPKGQTPAPAAAKETKWQGTIVRISKEKSTMDIRGESTASASTTLHVAFDSSTEWTKQGKPTDQSGFKEGEFVIILGKVDDKGVLHATRIDLRLPR